MLVMVDMINLMPAKYLFFCCRKILRTEQLFGDECINASSISWRR